MENLSKIRLNLLAPGRYDSDFKSIIFKLIIQKSSLGTCSNITLRWMTQKLINEKSTLVQVMAWCYQAASQGSHTQLYSKLPEFCLIFAWDTAEFPRCEHSKYQNISASTIPLHPSYPPHLLDNETILIETASTMRILPEFCLNFFKLPGDFWNCHSYPWVCRKSHFAKVLQIHGNPASHYQSQCWPRSMSPHGISRPQWNLYKILTIHHLFSVNESSMNFQRAWQSQCSVQYFWICQLK